MKSGGQLTLLTPPVPLRIVACEHCLSEPFHSLTLFDSKVNHLVTSSAGVSSLCSSLSPFSPVDNIRTMMIVWRIKPGFHYQSWRPELTARVDGWPVSTSRVDGASTRLVQTKPGLREKIIRTLLCCVLYLWRPTVEEDLDWYDCQTHMSRVCTVVHCAVLEAIS